MDSKLASVLFYLLLG